MADTAAISRHRSMDKFATTDGFVMAPETQSGSCAFELELIGGLMRIVASCALTLFNRLMHNGAVV